MRSAAWLVVLAGCSGVVEAIDDGAPVDSGSSDSVVDAGQVAIDAGSFDAGQPPILVDAGRVFSTDRLTYFGAPRCGAAGVLFCDDFESRADQAAPDPASWVPEYWGHPAGTTVNIDASRAARGSKSAHFRIGAGSDKAMMVIKKIFPVANNTFWVRLFLYMDTVPLPFKWNDTANFPLTHWTFAEATGDYTFASGKKRPQLRAGGFINTVLLMNEDGMDRAEVAIDDSNAPTGQAALPAKQWVCFEMLWNGPDQEMRLFWDGVEHPGLHLTRSHTGGDPKDSNPPWPMPTFDALNLGLVMYQAYSKLGPSIDVNIDEVAIDTQRIGCGL